MSEPVDRSGRPAIEAAALSKSFGRQIVLDAADLVVDYGDFVALGGPSGSGKSTLLHLCAALDTADSGSITVDGITLSGHRHQNLAKFRRDHVGIVFQLHNLIPRLTASQNIELAMFGTHRSKSERLERATDLLTSLDLATKACRQPPTMSGGERARVALARGLANEPPVMLADEPTSNLDDTSAAEVIAQLRTLADSGVAVLAVSHDSRLISQASRRLLLSQGKIVELDHTQQPSLH